ncbi:hypothetical protein E4T56_gene18173 [Termitomyces sp. T112]|nr:hypothetical protein E4T56_gene18173 [Termitomyces sp. T112]
MLCLIIRSFQKFKDFFLVILCQCRGCGDIEHGMPVSTITISAETFIGLARSTINGSGIRCEWGHGRDTCPVVVSCWEALKLHYRWHVLSLRPKKDNLSRDVVHAMCRLPRCNTSLGHNSLEQLWKHVENSHLSRVPLVCPVEGCRPHLRSSHVAIKHFSDEHGNLNETTHSPLSPLLKPSWKPFFPSIALAPPPPLPQNPNPGCVLVSTFPSVLRSRKSLIAFPLSSQASLSNTSPRKQSQQIPKVLVEDDDLDVPDFDQLPIYRWDDVYWSDEITVWRPPAVFSMDVARPQRMLDGLLSETPKSISYEVFAKHVDGLECKGLLQ